jgi:hypothetical protein
MEMGLINWIRRRDRLGASARLMKELAEEDTKGYRNIMRMAVVKFEELLPFHFNVPSPILLAERTQLVLRQLMCTCFSTRR